MTVPDNLSVKFSLHTKAKIETVSAEFPAQTTITAAGEPQPDTRVYEVAFKKLGENKLTINTTADARPTLEFFVTEPLETLIKKRAQFLVNKQTDQRPVPSVERRIRTVRHARQGTRTIDDPDIFLDRMVYALTCDDPGLSKAPFLSPRRTRRSRTRRRSRRSSTTSNISCGADCSGKMMSVLSIWRVRHAGLVHQSRSGAAEGLRRAPGERRDGTARSGQRTRVAVVRLPARDHAVFPHVSDREAVSRDVEVSRLVWIPQPRVGNGARVLYLSVRNLPSYYETPSGACTTSWWCWT